MQRGEKLPGRSVSNGHHRWFVKPMLLMGCAGLFAVLVGLVVTVHSGWHVKAAAQSSDHVWKVTSETTPERQAGNRDIPAQARLWQLDEAALQRVLGQALPEGAGAIRESPAVLSLPMPDGDVARFRIVYSLVLAA